ELLARVPLVAVEPALLARMRGDGVGELLLRVVGQSLARRAGDRLAVRRGDDLAEARQAAVLLDVHLPLSLAQPHLDLVLRGAAPLAPLVGVGRDDAMQQVVEAVRGCVDLRAAAQVVRSGVEQGRTAPRGLAGDLGLETQGPQG